MSREDWEGTPGLLSMLTKLADGLGKRDFPRENG